MLKEYNNSDPYAIAVGHLADRMNGGAAIKAAWPADDRPISRDARIALQKKLSALGYKVFDFEGHIDFDLRDNIRAEQVSWACCRMATRPRRFSTAWREAVINAPFSMRVVFRFEPHHFKQVADGVEAVAARHSMSVVWLAT